jgi:hypothetical protein
MNRVLTGAQLAHRSDENKGRNRRTLHGTPDRVIGETFSLLAGSGRV